MSTLCSHCLSGVELQHVSDVAASASPSNIKHSVGHIYLACFRTSELNRLKVGVETITYGVGTELVFLLQMIWDSKQL